MSRTGALQAASKASLDTMVTVTRWPTAYLRRSPPSTPPVESYELWSNVSTDVVRAAIPGFIGGDFSADIAAGYLVRWDPRLVGVVPAQITVNAGPARVSVIGRRRFLVLST